MNTAQLPILHNDCMVDLWSGCVHNSEQYNEFLLSQLSSVTQKLNLMKNKKTREENIFVSHEKRLFSSTEDVHPMFDL